MESGPNDHAERLGLISLGGAELICGQGERIEARSFCSLTLITSGLAPARWNGCRTQRVVNRGALPVT